MNNQKLIMETWRRYLNEDSLEESQRQFQEQVDQMDEGLRDLAFGALLTIGSMLGADAQAGGIEDFGSQTHTQQQVDDASTAAKKVSQKGGPDALAFKNAGKLLDYVSGSPKDVSDSSLTSQDLQKELGMSQDEIMDAYTVAHKALDHVSNKAPKKASDVKPDAKPKGPSAMDVMKMQRKTNPDAPDSMKAAHQDLVKQKNW